MKFSNLIQVQCNALSASFRVVNVTSDNRGRYIEDVCGVYPILSDKYAISDVIFQETFWSWSSQRHVILPQAI